MAPGGELLHRGPKQEHTWIGRSEADGARGNNSRAVTTLQILLPGPLNIARINDLSGLPSRNVDFRQPRIIRSPAL